jgi:hypothetical protein
MRVELRQEMEAVKRVFVDEYGELSYKKCVNILVRVHLLTGSGIR